MKVCIFFSHYKFRVEDLHSSKVNRSEGLPKKKGTFFDASLLEIESILFDACM